jgi:hypothetical protein
MKHRAIRHTFLLAVTLFLSSCVLPWERRPMDCAEIGDARLADFPFNQPTVEVALAWIQEQYDLDKKDIFVSGRTEAGIEYLLWKLEDKDYQVSLWDRGEPIVSAGLKWQSNSPTLGDALRCFGDPKEYRAYYKQWPEALYTNLELWYPDRGLIFSTFVTRKIAHYSTGVGLRGAQYVKPGSEQELVFRSWVVSPGSAAYNDILNSLRPWPGDIKDVTIDDAR